MAKEYLPEIPEKVESVEILAWVGEDEMGSGEIGMKQLFIPSQGITNLAGVDKPDSWVRRESIEQAMQQQSDIYGKTIYLCRYELVEVEEIVAPRKG